MNKATLNRTKLNSLATACAALALVLSMVPATAQEAGRTRVGTLTCNISPGVGLIVAGQRQLSCIYASARGRARQAYEGIVSTLGLDIGATSGGQLTWAVFAPTTLRRAALAGTYAGATAGGTVGVGASANVLVGGSDRTVVLQPVSVQAQTELDLADVVLERTVFQLMKNAKNRRSVQVINGLKKGNLTRALNGEPVGTVITA